MDFDEGLEEVWQSETDTTLEKRLSTARATAAAKQRELSGVRKELDEARDEIASLYLELEAFNIPRQQPGWMTPKKTKGRLHRATLVTPFGDSHYGEVVKPEEVGGSNCYNMEISEKRTKRFFERAIMLSRDYLAGVKYDGLVLPFLGDLVSGDIHSELEETNELSTYETVLAVAPWLAAGIGMFIEEFKRVHITSVPGNHGRNTRKPRYKRRSANNADTLLVKILAHEFRGEKAVTWDVPDSMTADFRIYDVGFRTEHGDEAKGGTGIQGALAPLMLRVHRQRRVAQAEGAPFDVLMVGHFHQLMSLPAKGLFVNGASKGYDEFARGKGFEPEPPQQGLIVVTPEHGATVQAPIFVSKRSAEGW